MKNEDIKARDCALAEPQTESVVADRMKLLKNLEIVARKPEPCTTADDGVAHAQQGPTIIPASGAVAAHGYPPKTGTDEEMPEGKDDPSIAKCQSESENQNPNALLRISPSPLVASVSLPGAHRTGPSGRQENVPRDAGIGIDLPPSFGAGTGHETSEQGLVQADPVCMSTEQAEPIGSLEQVEYEKRKRKNNQWKLMLLGLMLLVVAAICLSLGLLLKSDNSSSTLQSAAQSGNKGITTSIETRAPTPWTWDLRFAVPNTTLRTIERDTTQLTPQTKAYLWVKVNPDLEAYSEPRLLQRFNMATLYYATLGEQWKNQGGGVATVTIAAATTVGLAQTQEKPGDQMVPSPGLRQNGQATHNPVDATKAPGAKPPHKGERTMQINVTSEPWLSYEHSECEWFHVPGDRNKTMCNSDEEVENLDLTRNNLQGSLPEELGLLSSLSFFNLEMNKLGGPIIPQIGNLKNLSSVRLGRNRFTGTVPSEIGLLSQLKYFSILDNDLSGALPTELWSLTRLDVLKLDRNELSGSFPSRVGDGMPHLRIFMAAKNSFTGSLPSSIGKLTALVRFTVDHNKLSGTIPTDIGKLSNTTMLFLSDNLFSGTIPTEIGLLTSLKSLQLNGNTDLSGPLPSELWGLSTLSKLYLDGSSVSGTIPDSFCGMKSLKFDCSPWLCGCDCPCQAT